MQAFIRPAKIFTSFVTKVTYQPGKGDRNLLFGVRRELLKTGSISRLRASYQHLDSESDKEKQPPFATLGKEYPIRKRYVNLALAYGQTWTSATDFALSACPHGQIRDL